MSHDAETNLSSVYLTRSSSTGYEQLCSLDVLGLEYKPAGDQQATNVKSNWYVTFRCGSRQGYCGALDILPSLTIEKEVSNNYLAW